MWRPLETASMIEKSILMPVFFTSPLLTSPLLSSSLCLHFLVMLSITHLEPTGTHWIKWHKTIRANTPCASNSFYLTLLHGSFISCLWFLVLDFQEESFLPRQNLRVGSTRMSHSNNVGLICYHIHNPVHSPPPTHTHTFFVIFQSSSLAAASW